MGEDPVEKATCCFLCPVTGVGVVKRKIADQKRMLCPCCFKISNRKFPKVRGKKKHRTVDVPTRLEWVDALKTAGATGTLRCGISGIELDTSNPSSPLYATLDHVDPSRKSAGWMVVAAAINDMKSDFSTDEFRSAVAALAVIFSSKTESARDSLQQQLANLKFWKRS